MRRFALAPLALSSLVTGCQGLSFPFQTSSNGEIRLSLKAPTAECVAEGSRVLDGGTPDDPSDDSVLSWEHSASDNVCTLSSGWQGTLLDMASIRDDVQTSIQEGGLGDRSVTVELTSIMPTIEKVSMIDNIDGDDDPDATDVFVQTIQRYAACVDTGTEACDQNDAGGGMLTVTTDGGSVEAPVTAINDPAALVAAANAAIAGEDDVAGTGAATTSANLVDDGTGTLVVPAALQALEDPTLVLTVRFDVDGTLLIAP
jgi:hypothetical protein